MIDFSFMAKEWKNLSDEEQCMLCKAVINEYERLEKSFHDKAVSDFYAKVENADYALKMFHNWRRVRTNLKYYAEPNILGENKWSIRFETIWKLYNICGFLEYINQQFLKEK